MGLFSRQPSAEGFGRGRKSPGFVADMSPQPIGDRDQITQSYLGGMSGQGTRQPPERRYPAQRPGRRAQIW